MSENKKNNPALRVMTTEFRVSHPHVFKPSQMMQNGKPVGEPSYSIEMLFDKKTTDLSMIKKPIHAAIVEKWGPNKADWPQGLSLPYRDGDKPHGKKREVKKEHQGMWVVKASSKAEYSAPHVVGRDPNVALEDEKDFYAGCYARAELKAFAYTFADKDGVKFVLNGVQKIRDGKPFGGKKAANEMFGVIAGDSGEGFDFGEDNDEIADDEETF